MVGQQGRTGSEAGLRDRHGGRPAVPSLSCVRAGPGGVQPGSSRRALQGSTQLLPGPALPLSPPVPDQTCCRWPPLPAQLPHSSALPVPEVPILGRPALRTGSHRPRSHPGTGGVVWCGSSRHRHSVTRSHAGSRVVALTRMWSEDWEEQRGEAGPRVCRGPGTGRRPGTSLGPLAGSGDSFPRSHLGPGCLPRSALRSTGCVP